MGNLGLYQTLTSAMKRAGGPEVWIETLKSDAGQRALAKATPYLMALGAGAGAGGVKIYETLQDRLAKRKESKAADAEEARRAQDEQDQADSPGGEGPQGKPSAD